MKTATLVLLLLLPCLLVLTCDKSTDPDTNDRKDPVLSVSVGSLNFATNQNALTFTIANTGAETLNWTITDDADWISVDTASGSTTTDTVSVTAAVDRVGLSVGSHTCNITVSSNGGTATVAVTMEASPLALSAYDFFFGPGDSVLTFEIMNNDTGTLHWTLAADQDWILVNPTSGSTSTERDVITIRFDSTQFDSGAPGKITVSEAGATKGLIWGSDEAAMWGSCEAAVDHEYFGRPRLMVLHEGTNELECWSKTEVCIYICNRAINPGGGALDWIALADQPWITISPSSGQIRSMQISTVAHITVDKSGFNRGSFYAGQVTISSNGGYAGVRVYCWDPIVGVSPTGLDFGEEETLLPLTIFNEGSGALHEDWFDWSAQPGESWMTVSKDQGTLNLDEPQEDINVMVNRDGLDPGTYSGELTVQSLCSSLDQFEIKIVTVSMVVPEKDSGGTLVMGLSHTGQIPYDLNDVLTIEFDLAIDAQKHITGSGIGTHTTLDVTSNTELIYIQNIQSVPMRFTFTGTARGANNDTLDFVMVPPEPAEAYAYTFELCNPVDCATATDGICPTVVIWNGIHFVVANETGATMSRSGVEDFGGGGYTYDWYFDLEIHKKQ